jgi:phosphonate transport system permease protein
VRNWHNGADKVAQMLQPSFAFLPRTWAPILETLQMTVVGAAVSALVSVPPDRLVAEKG